jgi:hypothetical protein
VQLWSEWCLYDVLQEAINRELEDEKRCLMAAGKKELV